MESSKDGNKQIMPKGQSKKIEQMNNPTAMAGIKENRKTGERPSGTAFLRGNKKGIEQK